MSKNNPGRLKFFLQKALFRRVAGGPFKGMRYIHNAHYAHYPKIVGTYEKEIWPYLEECTTWSKGVFVDVGAAEGYYAVGMLMLNPGLRCITFEAEEAARLEMQKLAAINGVAGSRIEAHGFGTHQDLQAALSTGEKTLLLVDIEGGEQALLDPVKVPALRHSTMVVEIHDWAFRPADALAIFRERFSDSHEIVEVKARTPSVSEIPNRLWRNLAQLNSGLGRSLVYERPLNMRWFCLRPRT